MKDVSATLIYTAADGWRLEPSPDLLQAVYPRSRRRRIPYRFNPERTRAINLEAGYRPEHVERFVARFSVEEKQHAVLL